MSGHTYRVKIQIGQILQFKAGIRKLKSDSKVTVTVQFEISAFGFELQDLSNYKISHATPCKSVYRRSLKACFVSSSIVFLRETSRLSCTLRPFASASSHLSL